MARLEVFTTRVDGKVITVEVVDNETGEISTGVAKCADGDKFDYEKGFKLAKAKAMRNATEAIKEFLSFQVMKTLIDLDKLSKELEKTIHEVDGRNAYINDLLDNM